MREWEKGSGGAALPARQVGQPMEFNSSRALIPNSRNR